MNYPLLLEAFYSATWAILPTKHATIKAVLERCAAGGHASRDEITAAKAASRPSPRTAGTVAVIPVYGVLCYRGNLISEASGLSSVQALTKQFRQALADPGVKAIVFDVDSPGGEVSGIPELCDEIYNARGIKKMVAISNPVAASAAYWLASAADEVIVTPSGSVGSIGVFCTHEDYSAANQMAGVNPTYVYAGKYKVEGNSDEPLSDEGRTALQSDVDLFYKMFVDSVARNRGVASTDVRSGFGQGRMVMARAAVRSKMADKVATYDQTLSRFVSGYSGGGISAGALQPIYVDEEARLRMTIRRMQNDQAAQDAGLPTHEERKEESREQMRKRKVENDEQAAKAGLPTSEEYKQSARKKLEQRRAELQRLALPSSVRKHLPKGF